MRQRIKNFFQLMRTELKNRKAFYKNAADENAVFNIKNLLAANVAALVFLIGFLLLTPYIIAGWQPTPYHLGFLPALFLCFIITLLYFLRKNWQGRTVSILCILFFLVLLTFSILLDTVGTPEGSGTFLPMMFIIIPSLFTLPFYISYFLCIGAEIVYIFLLCTLKRNIIGQYDAFSSIVALAFSVIVANMILSLKVRDHTIQAKYKQLSMTDTLTNILNKTASFTAFQEYFETCNPFVTCTLIIMDLDHFKTLNDTKGHAAGDRVLHRVGMLLTDTFRRYDVIGRFGGDEFVILLKGVASEAILNERCRNIQNNLRSVSSAVSGMEITGSFGVILVKDQKVELQSLFDQADRALYEAKRSGRATFAIQEYLTEQH